MGSLYKDMLKVMWLTPSIQEATSMNRDSYWISEGLGSMYRVSYNVLPTAGTLRLCATFTLAWREDSGIFVGAYDWAVNIFRAGSQHMSLRAWVYLPCARLQLVPDLTSSQSSNALSYEGLVFLLGHHNSCIGGALMTTKHELASSYITPSNDYSIHYSKQLFPLVPIYLFVILRVHRRYHVLGECSRSRRRRQLGVSFRAFKLCE
jgi:hypothetical protein